MTIKQILLKYAGQVGYGPELVGFHDRIIRNSQVGDINQELVGDSIREYELPESDVQGNVLFPMVEGRTGDTNYRYCILAHAFRARGYRPIIPVCYNDLSFCHEKSPQRQDRSVCEICNYKSNRHLEAFGLPETAFSEFKSSHQATVSDPETVDSLEYNGVAIGDYATASIRQILKRYHIELDDPQQKQLYTQLIDSAAMIAEVAESLIETYDITAIVTHHPNYIYGGVFMAVGENHGIPSYSFKPGFSENKIMFGKQSNQMSTPMFTDVDSVEDYLSNPLSPDETNRLETFMNERFSGANTNFDYSSRTGNSISLAADETIGMFTNLIWDDSLAFDSERLPSYFEWIDETVEYFRDNPQQGLVIKTHPAEEVHGTNESIAQYVRDRFSDLPKNVRLLDPDTRVDTYALVRTIDAGVVYNSTVGLEAAYLGTPVIVTGITHYRNHGFTFDTVSVEEYTQTLADAGDLSMDQQMQDRARRYAYLLFINKQMDFPFIKYDESTESGYGYELYPVTHEQVGSGVETFDRIVDAVVHDRTVWNASREDK